MRIDDLTGGEQVLLGFKDDVSEPAMFVRHEGEGEDREAVFSQQHEVTGEDFEWKAYRYQGRWAYGTSADRLRLVRVLAGPNGPTVDVTDVYVATQQYAARIVSTIARTFSDAGSLHVRDGDGAIVVQVVGRRTPIELFVEVSGHVTGHKRLTRAEMVARMKELDERLREQIGDEGPQREFFEGYHEDVQKLLCEFE